MTIIQLTEHKRLVLETKAFEDGNVGTQIAVQYNTKKDPEWKYAKGGLFLNHNNLKAIKELRKALKNIIKQEQENA